MYVSIRDPFAFYAGATIAQGLQNLGLDAIELEVDRKLHAHSLTGAGGNPPVDLSSPGGVHQFMDCLAGQKVRVSCLFMAQNFGAADYAAEVQWTKRVVGLAHALRVPAVRLDGAIARRTLAERVAVFAGAVKQVLHETPDTAVDLGVENHGVGNQQEFLDGLLEAVHAPRFGLTLDVGNFYWYGYPLTKVYELYRHFAPAAKHTHIKNINYPAELRQKSRPVGYDYGKYACPLAEGNIDLGKLVGILRAAGYDRDLCIEDESVTRYPNAQKRQNLRHDADLLRKLIGEPAR